MKVLKVSRRGYYQWLESKPSKWKLENEEGIKQIRKYIRKADRFMEVPGLQKN